mmetsp:Transcript_1502/g.5640  ORF Transcript_1502/g.5640 Transcript_1502/m.5640 type:complete len:169 (+) Transcript_1502:1708-2214(+)
MCISEEEFNSFEPHAGRRAVTAVPFQPEAVRTNYFKSESTEGRVFFDRIASYRTFCRMACLATHGCHASSSGLVPHPFPRERESQRRPKRASFRSLKRWTCHEKEVFVRYLNMIVSVSRRKRTRGVAHIDPCSHLYIAPCSAVVMRLSDPVCGFLSSEKEIPPTTRSS